MAENGVSEVGSGSDLGLLVRPGQGGLECWTLVCALCVLLFNRYSQLLLRPPTALAVGEHVVTGQGQDVWCRLMRAVMELGAARAPRKPLSQPGVGRQPKHQDAVDEEKTPFSTGPKSQGGGIYWPM